MRGLNRKQENYGTIAIMRKRYIFIALGVAALILSIIAVTSVGPQVVLLNECGELVSDIQLEYDGGISTVKGLPDKGAVSLKIFQVRSPV